jgi:hypothetical protein
MEIAGLDKNRANNEAVEFSNVYQKTSLFN